MAALSPPQRSNEVKTLARRITGEILRARGQVVNESRLGNDLTEACAFARQTLKDWGGFARQPIQAARDTQTCPPQTVYQELPPPNSRETQSCPPPTVKPSQAARDGGGFARQPSQGARDTQSCPPPTVSPRQPTSVSIADVVSEMRQSASACVIIIDAVNQLEGGTAHALDWLPSAEDCVNLPPGVGT